MESPSDDQWTWCTRRGCRRVARGDRRRGRIGPPCRFSDTGQMPMRTPMARTPGPSTQVDGSRCLQPCQDPIILGRAKEFLRIRASSRGTKLRLFHERKILLAPLLSLARLRREMAAATSCGVPTHSNGLNPLFPDNCSMRGARDLSLRRFFLKIFSRVFCLTNGERMTYTNRHLAHFPHHFSVGFCFPDFVFLASLQLKNTPKYFEYPANIFAI